MEERKRIILLAELYKDYTENLNLVEKALYESIKEDRTYWEINIHLRDVIEWTKRVDQVLDWLKDECVVCIYDDKENKKICIDTTHLGTLKIDGIIGDPYKVDFPISNTFVYEDEDD